MPHPLQPHVGARLSVFAAVALCAAACGGGPLTAAIEATLADS